MNIKEYKYTFNNQYFQGKQMWPNNIGFDDTYVYWADLNWTYSAPDYYATGFTIYKLPLDDPTGTPIPIISRYMTSTKFNKFTLSLFIQGTILNAVLGITNGSGVLQVLGIWTLDFSTWNTYSRIETVNGMILFCSRYDIYTYSLDAGSGQYYIYSRSIYYSALHNYCLHNGSIEDVFYINQNFIINYSKYFIVGGINNSEIKIYASTFDSSIGFRTINEVKSITLPTGETVYRPSTPLSSYRISCMFINNYFDDFFITYRSYEKFDANLCVFTTKNYKYKYNFLTKSLNYNSVTNGVCYFHYSTNITFGYDNYKKVNYISIGSESAGMTIYRRFQNAIVKYKVFSTFTNESGLGWNTYFINPLSSYALTEQTIDTWVENDNLLKFTYISDIVKGDKVEFEKVGDLSDFDENQFITLFDENDDIIIHGFIKDLTQSNDLVKGIIQSPKYDDLQRNINLPIKSDNNYYNIFIVIKKFTNFLTARLFSVLNDDDGIIFNQKLFDYLYLSLLQSNNNFYVDKSFVVQYQAQSSGISLDSTDIMNLEEEIIPNNNTELEIQSRKILNIDNRFSKMTVKTFESTPFGIKWFPFSSYTDIDNIVNSSTNDNFHNYKITFSKKHSFDIGNTIVISYPSFGLSSKTLYINSIKHNYINDHITIDTVDKFYYNVEEQFNKTNQVEQANSSVIFRHESAKIYLPDNCTESFFERVVDEINSNPSGGTIFLGKGSIKLTHVYYFTVPTRIIGQAGHNTDQYNFIMTDNAHLWFQANKCEVLYCSFECSTGSGSSNMLTFDNSYNLILGNTFEGSNNGGTNRQRMIHCKGSYDRIIGNIIHGTPSTPCYMGVLSSSLKATIIGNLIYTAQYGIFVNNAYNTINGNYIGGCTVSAIASTGANRTTIIGNIENGGQIYLNSMNSTVVGNSLGGSIVLGTSIAGSKIAHNVGDATHNI